MFQWPEEIPREEYTRLYFLEKALRRFIIDQLSKITNNWWEERVSDKVRGVAEKRKNREEQRGESSLDLHPIWYINFPQYRKIILENENWTNAFKSIFKSKKNIKDWLRRLVQIRNKIAHMKPLSTEEEKCLIKLSEDILLPIWECTCNEPYITPAKEFIAEGNNLKAEKLLLRGLRETGDDPWIAYNLAELYIDMEMMEDAEKWFEYAEKHLVLPRYKERAKAKLTQVKKQIKLNNIKICSNCGKNMLKEYSFCGNCGQKF